MTLSRTEALLLRMAELLRDFETVGFSEVQRAVILASWREIAPDVAEEVAAIRTATQREDVP